MLCNSSNTVSKDNISGKPIVLFLPLLIEARANLTFQLAVSLLFNWNVAKSSKLLCICPSFPSTVSSSKDSLISANSSSEKSSIEFSLILIFSLVKSLIICFSNCFQTSGLSILSNSAITFKLVPTDL